MTKLNPKIFRVFSIRGIVGDDFDSSGMKQMAEGIGRWFNKNRCDRLVIGYDVRKSSPELHSILSEGLLSTGIDVIDIGFVPTPLLNFATDYYRASGGIMVTASHNPPEYNGLKIRSDRTVYGDDLHNIYTLISSSENVGKRGYYEKQNPLDVYVNALLQHASVDRLLRVVVDGGHGANGQVVPPILRRLGFEVIELFCDLNGDFPSRDPDPTALNATYPLAQKVLETKSDIGLAFDGDGDRVIAVDELGQTVLGDYLLMLLTANAIENEATKKVVYEVLCSRAVPDYIVSKGGEAFPAASGYAFVHNVMMASGAQLGGEMSGHFFLLDDIFRFDDAILATVKILSLLSTKDKSLSQLIVELPHYFSSPEYRLDCPDDVKAKVVAQMREEYLNKGFSLEEIDGVGIDFGGTWALIRQSNTQPKISLRFESKISNERMREVKSFFFEKLKEVYWEYNLTFPDISD